MNTYIKTSDKDWCEIITSIPTTIPEGQSFGTVETTELEISDELKTKLNEIINHEVTKVITQNTYELTKANITIDGNITVGIVNGIFNGNEFQVRINNR